MDIIKPIAPGSPPKQHNINKRTSHTIKHETFPNWITAAAWDYWKLKEFEKLVALRAIFDKEIFDPKKLAYILLLLIQKEQVTSYFSECKTWDFEKVSNRKVIILYMK